jgi:hypothetical protein
MLTTLPKKEEESSSFLLNDYSVSQVLVNIVSAVLDGNYTTASTVLYNRNSFTAEATEREQKRIKLFVIGLNSLDNVFLSLFSVA